MAIDLKYGKVSLEHGDIGEDEPVIVFRAQDSLLPKLLCYYVAFCMKAGSPRHHIDAIQDSRDRILFWQQAHEHRVPNSNKYIARVRKGRRE